MATHIQIHRSAIGGATPDVGNMLEGEVAVNLTDKKFYIKGTKNIWFKKSTNQIKQYNN